MAKPKIAVIISTTRATRFSEKPARWIYDIARARTDMSVELIEPARLPDALFRRAGGERLGAVEERGGQALAEEGRRVRRLYLCHRGIQPQHARGAQERSRLRLSGMEPQGGRLRGIRQCRRRPLDRAPETRLRRAADGPDASRRASPGRRFHGRIAAGQG